MSNPFGSSPNYERPSGGQVKMVQGARSHNTVNVAPVARSIVALLAAIQVPDEHMNGVWELFLADDRFMYRAPVTPQEIMADVREAWATYRAENVDAR